MEKCELWVSKPFVAASPVLALDGPYQRQSCGRVRNPPHPTLNLTDELSSPLGCALGLVLQVSTPAHKATSNMPCTFYLYEDEALGCVFDLGTKGSELKKLQKITVMFGILTILRSIKDSGEMLYFNVSPENVSCACAV